MRRRRAKAAKAKERPHLAGRAKPLLRMGGIFLAALTVLALLWPFVIPTYSYTVVQVAQQVYRIAERPARTLLRADEGDVRVYELDRATGEWKLFRGYNAYNFMGLFLFFALVAATPGLHVRWLLSTVGLGVVALFVFHVFYLILVIGLARASEYAVPGSVPYSIYSWLHALSSILWEGVPVLFWWGFMRRVRA